jgi:hypothetical protein
MNHIRWAAWGVIDIEKLERMQRRNYIKRARAELKAADIKLECGGSTNVPFYRVSLPGDKAQSQGYGGPASFQKVCVWTLQKVGDDHERGEDGGVRRAGDEA